MTPKVENYQNCYNSVSTLEKWYTSRKVILIRSQNWAILLAAFLKKKNSTGLIKSSQNFSQAWSFLYLNKTRSDYFVFCNDLCSLVREYIKVLLKSSPDLRSIGCLVVHGVVVFSLLSTRWWAHMVSHAGVQEPVLLRFLDLE